MFTRIGQFNNGGYFAGFVRSNNTISALLVSPTVTQRRLIQDRDSLLKNWHFESTYLNGQENTQKLAAEFDSFKQIVSCSNNNYCDWYLPGYIELLIICLNLKPCTFAVRITKSRSVVQHCVPCYQDDLAESSQQAPIVVPFFNNSQFSFNKRVYVSSTYTGYASGTIAIDFSNGSVFKCDWFSSQSHNFRLVRKEVVAGEYHDSDPLRTNN